MRNREKALPTPQGWSSGRQTVGRAPDPGRVALLPDPRARPALCVSATKGWRQCRNLLKTGPWLRLSPAEGQAAAVSGRRLSAQPTERLCSSILRLGPFRQLPQPISKRRPKNALPMTSRTLGPPLVAWLGTPNRPASSPVACRELEFQSGVQRPVRGQKPRREKNKRVKKHVLLAKAEYLPLSSIGDHNPIKPGGCPTLPRGPRSLS